MQTQFNFLRLSAALMLVICISGCAANMAASGHHGPDLDVVMREATRLDVERHLGSPRSSHTLNNGHQVMVYEVPPNIDPSLGRAAVHGTLDLFTFGLWEVIGGPAEAYASRQVEVTVEYDGQGNLVRLQHRQPGL